MDQLNPNCFVLVKALFFLLMNKMCGDQVIFVAFVEFSDCFECIVSFPATNLYNLVVFSFSFHPSMGVFPFGIYFCVS